MQILLASASPRRAELLATAGYVFAVKPCTVDETPLPGEIPALYVARLAAAKADAVTDVATNNVILGADTCVVLDGDILGKPIDDADAARMLGRLSGRSHEVLTGVSMRYANQRVGAVDRTVVHVAPLQPEHVRWYVASGEPRDKAGAYAIQGLAARFIDRIEGSYSNVVGLPLAVVRRLLDELGFDGAQISENP
ncbi:uncharacterized protein METZ01_LOCUS64159 [marine metagenome]|uniref:Uncharacterized protein n=1 Tax=marine metagenome TaxID=408172 RepID=A0A381T561_9ZZZZ|tara:strand:- start:733 stop:1317 length:585 start_codon:yes stop_codon:yes gene_type:complete